MYVVYISNCTQYKRSEIPKTLQGHIISRGVYHSNRSGEQIMRRKVHRNLHTAHLTVNVDKFHSILTVIQKFQTLPKHTSEIIGLFNRTKIILTNYVLLIFQKNLGLLQC